MGTILTTRRSSVSTRSPGATDNGGKPEGLGGGGGSDYSVSPAVNINIEIHIAADAKPATIQEIFKNMRTYVLNKPDDKPDDEASGA